MRKIPTVLHPTQGKTTSQQMTNEYRGRALRYAPWTEGSRDWVKERCTLTLDRGRSPLLLFFFEPMEVCSAKNAGRDLRCVENVLTKESVDPSDRFEVRLANRVSRFAAMPRRWPYSVRRSAGDRRSRDRQTLASVGAVAVPIGPLVTALLFVGLPIQ